MECEASSAGIDCWGVGVRVVVCEELFMYEYGVCYWVYWS